MQPVEMKSEEMQSVEMKSEEMQVQKMQFKPEMQLPVSDVKPKRLL